MVKTFILNGETVDARAFDFNLLCELDDFGVSIQDAGARPMSFVRAYIALCKGSDLKTAGDDIQAHMANGGDLSNIFEVINKELEASDFFRNEQSKTNPKKATKAQAK